ncbi:hypothetical protein P7K49_004400, partial [Saguinus oedipus]
MEYRSDLKRVVPQLVVPTDVPWSHDTQELREKEHRVSLCDGSSHAACFCSGVLCCLHFHPVFWLQSGFGSYLCAKNFDALSQ